MDGHAVGTACFRAAEDVVSAACSSISGMSAAGAVSCKAPSLLGDVVSYTLVVESGTGRTERAATLDLQQCVPFDITEYGPAIAAWFLACVTVLCARMLWSRTFKGE